MTVTNRMPDPGKKFLWSRLCQTGYLPLSLSVSLCPAPNHFVPTARNTGFPFFLLSQLYQNTHRTCFIRLKNAVVFYDSPSTTYIATQPTLTFDSIAILTLLLFDISLLVIYHVGQLVF